MANIGSGHSITHVIIRKEKAASDERLSKPNKNGRKILANKIRPDKSLPIQKPEWDPPKPGEKSQILETGRGGLEVATFNEKTSQKPHKHLIATEIYIVLAGEMQIRIEGKIVNLRQGDEIVVLPGTTHEIISTGTFLARVHSVNCHGDNDKYDV